MKLTLVSGAEWPVTLSDMLLALGILLLLLEVIKGARPGAKYLTDHLLSLIVFGAAAAEFVLWPKFGTSTYFLLTLLALVDFLSGIALRTRRGASRWRRLRRPARAPRKPRRRRPNRNSSLHLRHAAPPAPPVPPAASVAESVLLDHPEPKSAHAAVTPMRPSPEVPSPGLQPGDGSPSVAGQRRRADRRQSHAQR